MLPDTAHRSEASTPRSINARIRRQTEWSVARTTAAGVDVIDARLRELDQEWDTERALEAFAASFNLLGISLGLSVSRKWFALPGVVSAFLMQHALQGWCPPLPLIRALGVRTAAEIDQERYALKAARGDFARIGYGAASPRSLLTAAER
jgi:hypothetical protein